jgi:phage-related protein
MEFSLDDVNNFVNLRRNMNGVRIVFFMDGRGVAPVLKWLDGLPVRALDKCMARLELLGQHGHTLGPPSVKPLRNGLLELRVVSSGNQYRLLFFFHGGRIVVLAHAFLKKTNRVPKKEIAIALKRKAAFEANPEAHTYRE